MSSFNSLFKWVILFLVICSFIWLSFFYIVGRYEPDTRIKQVGFIEEIKSKTDKRKMEIFNINSKFAFKSQFLQLFQIQTLLESEKQCQRQDRNSVLIFSTNVKLIGDKYANLFKYMKTSEQKLKCKNPRIFVLRQLKYLLLNKQDRLKRYSAQISDAINLLTQLTPLQKRLSILAYEESSLLLLSYFTHTEITPIFKRAMAKIDKTILINTFNPLIKIYQNSAYAYVQRLKYQILQSQQRLQIFNSLNLIMISTLKKCQYFEDQHHQFIFNSNMQFYKIDNKCNSNKQIIGCKPQNLNQSSNLIQISQLSEIQHPNINYLNIQTEKFKLQNTLSISTRQIYNLHTIISQKNYFIFTPFLKIIGKFFLQNSLRNISMKGVQFYFRYGQTFSKYPFQIIQKMDTDLCTSFKWTTSEPTIWLHSSSCFKISVIAKFRQSAFIISSKHGNFGIYDSNLNKLEAFDNIGGQKIYLMQKLSQELLIINPDDLQIHITATKIFSPRNPLTKIMSQFDIFYISQLGQKTQPNMNYFVIRTCPNNLLLFPIHFSAGNLKRNPLLQESERTCYQDSATFQNLIQYYLINWNLIKNLMVFTLFLSHWRKKGVIHSFCYQLVANFILSYNNSERVSQLFTLNMIVLCIVVVIQQIFSIITFLCQFIQIQRKRTLACLFLIFFVSLLCQNFQFQNFNYWKMMLLFVIFFIGKSNISIFALKTHFVSDNIVYGIISFPQIIQIVLYLEATSIQPVKLKTFKYDANSTYREISRHIAQKKKLKLIKLIQNGTQVICAILIGFYLQGDGVQIDAIISMYMKVVIIIKTFQHKL